MSPAMEPPRWRQDIHHAASFIGKSVPVNKSGWSGGQGPPLPEVHSRLVQRVLAVASVGVGALTRRLHPERRSGRSERFRWLIVQAMRERWGFSAHDVDVEVRVYESFGKPALISIDVGVAVAGSTDDSRAMVELCLKKAWNNPEIAPVSVRVTLRSLEESNASVRTVAPQVTTAHSVGFADETARPAELYQRFGAPAFDPSWRP